MNEDAECKVLEWGQTPFDDWDRDRLLLEVRRMFHALQSAHSVLRMCRDGSAFWGQEGTGGRALTLAAEVMGPIESQYEDETIYRSYYRYAVDLLFSPEVGVGWMVCDQCGSMWGRGGNRSLAATCISPKCNCAPLRPLAWSDLEPKP